MRWPFNRRQTVIWLIGVTAVLVITNVFGLLIGAAALLVACVLLRAGLPRR
jgi:hypothetical protein